MTDLEEIITLLQQTPLFGRVSDANLWRIATLCTPQVFRAEQLLMQEGAVADGCYIITAGEVEVFREHQQQKMVLARLGAGNIVGEMGIFDDAPRSATVMACCETTVLALTAWDFKAQLQAVPEMALQLLPVLAERLRQAQNQLLRLATHE